MRVSYQSRSRSCLCVLLSTNIFLSTCHYSLKSSVSCYPSNYESTPCQSCEQRPSSPKTKNAQTIKSKQVERTITGVSSDWAKPFNTSWITVSSTELFVTVTHSVTGSNGLFVENFVSHGVGAAVYSRDPLTTGTSALSADKTATTPIIIRCTAGGSFPQLSGEMEGTTADGLVDPASAIRTILSDSVPYGVEATCGSVAGQDLSFDTDTIRIVFSTWDSGQYEMPEQDMRYRSCTATAGSVPSGTPCRFPFEYKGVIYRECTSIDWDTPWCSTTGVYEGKWGECTCTPLKRGAAFKTQAAINPSGPLSTVAGSRLPDFLSIYTGGVVGGAAMFNATAEAFFPIFDSEEINDLEFAVSFLPRDASDCGSTNVQLTPIEVPPPLLPTLFSSILRIFSPFAPSLTFPETATAQGTMKYLGAFLCMQT